MSEAELHLLRGRLLAGLRHKAAKGLLRVPLPVGYEYDIDDKVIVCRDDAVRVAVAGIFTRFAELGSVNQVLKSFLQDGLDLPRRRPKGPVEWTPPTLACLYAVLTNPCYAGAFVFGRSKTSRGVGEGAAATRRTRRLPPEEWSVVIADHHRGYISWETFEANVARVAANRTQIVLRAHVLRAHVLRSLKPTNGAHPRRPISYRDAPFRFKRPTAVRSCLR